MSEQFDIDLKNHIIEVFENYEDLSADAGWQLLRQKFPEEKKERGFIWWYGVAAGLLVFLGLFFIASKKTQEVANHLKAKTGTDVIAGNKLPQKHIPAIKLENSGALVEAKKSSKANSLKEKYQRGYIQPKTTFTDDIARVNKHQPQTEIVHANPELPIIASAQPQANATTNNMVPKQEPAKTGDVATAIVPEKPIVDNTVTDPVLKMMAEDKTKQANTVNKKAQPKTESILSVSPYAATYFNYARGSSNQVNVGAGITTDVKLSGKLKLSTGVAIAQNTLDFGGNSVPFQAATAVLNYAAVANSANASAGNSSGSNLSGATIYGIYFNNYKANLIGLDVPVNLKYQVNNSLSVSGGFSSGTFINETYTTTFGSGGSNNSSVYNNSNHFGTFDFARTVNFSVGVGYPVGGNHIIVEPFLKYPIGGLGSQNIRFGASGINLKFNFGTQKK